MKVGAVFAPTVYFTAEERTVHATHAAISSTGTCAIFNISAVNHIATGGQQKQKW